jgi:hypothetical protein
MPQLLHEVVAELERERFVGLVSEVQGHSNMLQASESIAAYDVGRVAALGNTIV